MHQLHGKRIVIMGLGRFGGGVGAARFCAENGADVLVTDMARESELARSLDRLQDLPLRYRLGGHDRADFTDADLIVVNPAVDRRNNPYLAAAEHAGAELTSEIELLVERLDRARCIGVTGTAGKSTTTAMIGHILAHAHGPEHVHVGGNIGDSLLGELDRIKPRDWVVLELSSFMLETLGEWSPHIAVVTNVGDNHLDRHGHIDAYVHAKKTILRHQTHDDRVVLGPGVADWRFDTPATHIIEEDPLDIELLIPGEHNRLNAALAAAACDCAGVPRRQAVHALRTFRGLPHRLQAVGEHGGVRFYDDSKCTTPEAAILAIDSFDHRQAHAILGGYDKGADLSELARHAASRCAGVYTIGHTGHAIAEAAEATADRCPVQRCGILPVAVEQAVRHAAPQQVVLLSPGCASWDQFENYERRGQHFAELVRRHAVEA